MWGDVCFVGGFGDVVFDIWFICKYLFVFLGFEGIIEGVYVVVGVDVGIFEQVLGVVDGFVCFQDCVGLIWIVCCQMVCCVDFGYVSVYDQNVY